MQTHTYNTFKYPELSEAAKNKAIEYFAIRAFTEFCDWEYVYNDAASVAALLGIDIATKSNKHSEPAIWFSGFYSQGDGACFEGTYSYKKGALKAVKEYAPLDTELQRIAKCLQDIQRKNFYRLTAKMTHTGRYCHSGCMSVYVQDIQYDDVPMSDEDIVVQLMRDFADWIYSRLEAEHDYQTNRGVIEENILAKDYDFTEDGELV